MDDNEEKFAVIMTLYKSDDLIFFEEALLSIEQQEVDEEIRIYLCIDGPIPERHEIFLRENEARFYRIIRNDRNIGLAKSLNRLIDLLEDETLVFRMDGDDVSHPERIAVQSAYMRTHPDIALVGCQAYDIDQSGNALKERRYVTEPEDVARLIGRMNPVLHPTYCVRREVFRDPQIRYPDMYLSEDLAFLMRMLGRRHKIANVDQVLFSWRLSPSFLKRRTDFKRGWVECKLYSQAIWSQRGLFTADYRYPIGRLVIRCLPAGAIKLLYSGPLRQWMMRR